MTRSGRAFVALGLLVGLALMPSAAYAKTDRLEVSTDGQTWHQNLVEPLFAPDLLVVPTDELGASFHLRNSSKVPARATIALVNRSDQDSELQHHLAASVSIGDESSSSPVDLIGSMGCKTMVTGPTIAAGGTQQVHVDLAFVDVDDQTAQQSQARIGMVVTLNQTGPHGTAEICGEQAQTEPDCDSPGRSSVAVLGTSPDRADCPAAVDLPGTGAPKNLAGMFGMSVAMVLLGSLFVFLKRDRRGGSAPRHRAA